MMRDVQSRGDIPSTSCGLRAHRDNAAYGTYRDNAAWVNVNRADDMNGQAQPWPHVHVLHAHADQSHRMHATTAMGYLHSPVVRRARVQSCTSIILRSSAPSIMWVRGKRGRLARLIPMAACSSVRVVPSKPTNLPFKPTNLPSKPTNLPSSPTNLPSSPTGSTRTCVSSRRRVRCGSFREACRTQ